MGEFIAVTEMDAAAEATPWQEPRRVRIGRGWGWIYSAFGLFNRGMGVSVGICLFGLVLSIASGLIPGGGLLYQLFSMVFAAGLMSVAHRAHTMGYISFNDYFEGFRQQMGQLVLTAVIYLVLLFGLFFLVALAAGFSIGFHNLRHWEEMLRIDPTMALSLLLWVLVGFALLIPVMMAALFAPALVFFHQVAPWEALKLSLRGCWRNFWPLSWWGILATLLLLLGTLMLLVGLLVVVPVTGYSLYVAYRDIFLHDEI
jgi:hypothetical protein